MSDPSRLHNRRKTVQRRLTEIILGMSFCLLALSLLCLGAYEVHSYRRTTARSLSTMAEILAENSAAVLLFDDQKLAQEILSSLRVEPEVSSAALYNREGVLYATYPAAGSVDEFPKSPPRVLGLDLGLRELTLWKPVMQGEIRAGTIYVKGDLRGTYQRLGVLGSVLVIILAASTIVAVLIYQYLHQRISRPLANLVASAKKITFHKDYSIRAVKTSDDEFGDLTDALNAMLDQIHAYTRALNVARDEALAASRAKDEFLARLSHELRTPLSPVLLIVSDAATNPRFPEDIRADFDTIKKNIELEARLIDDLLDLTAIVRGKLVLHREKVALNSLIHDAVLKVQGESIKRHVRVNVALAPVNPVLECDPVRVQQAVWNILKNAVKFSPEGGVVTVRTQIRPEPRGVAITVTDQGIGMTPEELARVFTAFTQGDHAGKGGSHRYGGLGLGLAISRRVIELHGGQVSAQSEGKDRGSTFEIVLPLAEAVGPSEMPPETGNAEDPAFLTAARRSVLLVEDHEPTRVALRRLISRRNFEVACAGSLAEARTLLESNTYDLLVSDIGLPDGSGHELMQMYSARVGGLGIAVTGYGMESDVAKAREAGFTIHLTKPISVHSLDGALRSVFQDASSKPVG